MLAAVSPIPIVSNPLNNGNRLKVAEFVTSQGAGCIHRGRAQPARRYIGVNAMIPVSFSSPNMTSPFCKACPRGGIFKILKT
jgi:hypothetical protein